MHLEKLSVLEERLSALIDKFTRLREEKSVLERSLEDRIGQLRDLEHEVEQLRQERDVVRDRLSRLVEMVERLETLEAAETRQVE